MKSTDVKCDWCNNNAILCFESRKKKRTGLIGTGLFYYACIYHKRQLQDMHDGKNGREIIYVRNKK